MTRFFAIFMDLPPLSRKRGSVSPVSVLNGNEQLPLTEQNPQQLSLF